MHAVTSRIIIRVRAKSEGMRTLALYSLEETLQSFSYDPPVLVPKDHIVECSFDRYKFRMRDSRLDFVRLVVRHDLVFGALYDEFQMSMTAVV